MWDERFSNDEYAYGTEPNDFLKAHFSAIPKGKVLSLAEGEGRNAVFLAQMGYSVTAVDNSKLGLEKASKLAKKNNVEIELIHADLTQFDLGIEKWDGIVSIFFPLIAKLRKPLYKQVTKSLKKKGAFLIEAYTPEQIHFNTGGGNSIELMQSKQTLSSELTGLTFDHLDEVKRNIFEGCYHNGLSSVVQAIAHK